MLLRLRNSHSFPPNPPHLELSKLIQGAKEKEDSEARSLFFKQQISRIS